MPPLALPTSRLFRRAMLGAAVLSLLLFAWSVCMIIHFNAVPASVRLGASTVLKIASVLLPGPILLAFLAWTSPSPISRAIGWIVVLPTLFAAGVITWFTTTTLRPPFATANYDAAAVEGEAAAAAIINFDAPAMIDAKAVRESFNQQPQTREELVDLARRMRAAADRVKLAGAQAKGLRQAIIAPFNARGVNSTRSNEFARLCLGPISVDGVEKLSIELATGYEDFARRVDMLVEHWGQWQWAGEGRVRFSDPEVGRAYDALSDRPTPPAK